MPDENFWGTDWYRVPTKFQLMLNPDPDRKFLFFNFSGNRGCSDGFYLLPSSRRIYAATR